MGHRSILLTVIDSTNFLIYDYKVYDYNKQSTIQYNEVEQKESFEIDR